MRASVQRVVPEHAPLVVTAVSNEAAALDALSERDVDCVAVEHGASDGDAANERSNSDTADKRTDALDVLGLVRDTDPAIPVVIFEAAEASSVASDAISLDVTEYVREREVDDPLAVLARACHDAASTYRAEQDIAMLNNLARSVYERVTDGFFALDRDWRFTYLNDAAEETLAVSSDEVVGKNVWEVFPEAVGTDFYTEYHRAMASQEPVTFREHYPALEKTFEVRAFPSDDGLSVHFRTVVDDDVEHDDYFLELTDLLSSDLLNSIESLRRNLEDAGAAADDPATVDDALETVERMEALVNYSIRLANGRPMPGKHRNE